MSAMASSEGAEVPVRSLLHIRPLLPNEEQQGCRNIVQVGNQDETVTVHGRPYAFDCVVGEGGGHPRSYMCEQYILPLCRSVCSGINCAVLAYGQTSSGKTYTMGIGKEQLALLTGSPSRGLPTEGSGDSEGSLGASGGSPLSGAPPGAGPSAAGPAGDLVIPYALRQLFRLAASVRGRTFSFTVSFVEVYMEKYYDLLAQRAPVAAKTSRDGEVILVGAQLRHVTTMEEVVRLLQIGGHARITKGTNQNDRSSRSHAVLTIHVHSRACAAAGDADDDPDEATSRPAAAAAGDCDGGGGDGGGDVDDLAAALSAAPPLSAKLHLVDLAGSESVGRAGTVGLAAKEGNTINLSLMTLRNLIQMLASPQPARPSASGGGPAAPAPRGVLPYRDSKLTTLLRDALGGNSSTLFVACVSPADVNSHMTVSTLEFATTARRIRTKVAVNIGGGDSGEVLELHKIITRLRAEIEHLRRQAGSGPRTSPGSPGPTSSALSPRLLLPIPQLGSFSQPGGSPLRPGASPPSALLSAYHPAASCTHTPSGSNANVTLACGGLSELPTRNASVSCVEGAMGAATPQSVNSGPRCAGRLAGQECDGVADSGTPFRSATRVHNANDSGDDGEEMEGVKEHRGSDGDVEEGGDSAGEERGRRRTPRRPKERSPRLMLLTPEVLGSRRRGGGGLVGVRRSRSCTGGRVLGLLASPGPSRPGSGGGAGSGSSNGGLSTFSSYDRSVGSSCGRDAWGGGRSKALQQRVELLEAENETLQKQVVHLSAVIGDLRSQLDEAHAAALAAAAPPSPHTPTAVRGRRAYQTEGGADTANATLIAGAAPRSQRSPLSRCSPADSPLGAGATATIATPGEREVADRAASDGGSVAGLRQRSDSVTGGPAGLGQSDGEMETEHGEQGGRRDGMEVEGGEVVLDWGAGERAARGLLAEAAEALPAPPLETLEERPRSLLTWIRDHVSATEAQLREQQEALRGLLAAQGLGPAAGQGQGAAAQHGQGQGQQQQVSLPSRATLLSYTAQQLAGVEAELAALGAAAAAAAAAGGDETASCAETPGRVAELQARRQRLCDVRAAVEQMAQLQDALELQREVELLVGAYAGLYGSEQSTVTAPSMARAAAAVEEQRLALRRARRQQVLKDSAVAKEKIREIEALAGPPTPQQFAVVLACPLPSGSSISSSGSAQGGPPMPFHTHQQHMDTRRGAATCGPDGVVYAEWEAAGPEDEAQQQQLATSTSTPPLQPTTSSTSLFSSFLPTLTPTTSWRRTTSSREINLQHSGGQAGSGSGPLAALASIGSGGAGQAALSRTSTMPRPPAPPGPAAKRARVQLHLHQVSPWLDALLDWEVRGQYYGRALAGVTQEREAVYAQLQDVDRQLKELQDAAAQAGMVAAGAGSDGDSAASPGSAAVGCSASYASWAPPHVAAVLAAGEGAVQQHVRLLQAQQEKLMARLEDLCVEVAATQLALVEVQEGGCSAASERDEWWACVGSLDLARPVLRGLVERAAGYRSAFQDALQRAGQLEHQVSELELQCQEGEARLAAQCLELTATKAAALAAVAAPGLPNTRAAIAGLLPLAGGRRRSGAGVTAGGGPVSPAAIGSSSWAAATAAKAIDLAAPRWQVAAAGPDCPTPSAAAGAAPPTLPEVTQLAA